MSVASTDGEHRGGGGVGPPSTGGYAPSEGSREQRGATSGGSRQPSMRRLIGANGMAQSVASRSFSQAISERANVTSDQVIKLGRFTASAKAAAASGGSGTAGGRRAGTVGALLARLPKAKALAARQLCVERLDLAARWRALEERLGDAVRLGGEEEADVEPEVMAVLRLSLMENKKAIERAVGGGMAPVLLKRLREDPSLQGKLAMPAIEDEDFVQDEKEGRLAVRKLDRRQPARVSSYRHALHSHPTRRGNKSVWDEQHSRTGQEKFSYYQRQQVRYGRGRRGSTAFAGAWESVLQEAADAKRADVGGMPSDGEGEEDGVLGGAGSGAGHGGAMGPLERAAARAARRRMEAEAVVHNGTGVGAAPDGLGAESQAATRGEEDVDSTAAMGSVPSGVRGASGTSPGGDDANDEEEDNPELNPSEAAALATADALLRN